MTPNVDWTGPGVSTESLRDMRIVCQTANARNRPKVIKSPWHARRVELDTEWIRAIDAELKRRGAK